MEMILPIIRDFIVQLSSFWSWFVAPLNFGELNQFVPEVIRTPITILSFGGLVTILIIKLVALALSAIPVA